MFVDVGMVMFVSDLMIVMVIRAVTVVVRVMAMIVAVLDWRRVWCCGGVGARRQNTLATSCRLFRPTVQGI